MRMSQLSMNRQVGRAVRSPTRPEPDSRKTYNTEHPTSNSQWGIASHLVRCSALDVLLSQNPREFFGARLFEPQQLRRHNRSRVNRYHAHRRATTNAFILFSRAMPPR